jgi:hypothetical protein
VSSTRRWGCWRARRTPASDARHMALLPGSLYGATPEVDVDGAGRVLAGGARLREEGVEGVVARELQSGGGIAVHLRPGRRCAPQTSDYIIWTDC